MDFLSGSNKSDVYFGADSVSGLINYPSKSKLSFYSISDAEPIFSMKSFMIPSKNRREKNVDTHTRNQKSPRGFGAQKINRRSWHCTSFCHSRPCSFRLCPPRYIYHT
jgi:hypothetical protein